MRCGWLLATALLGAAPAQAQLSARELAGAVARPPRGARLPTSLAFTDQRGVAVTLGDVAGGHPLVLLFADYTCRHVCGPGLTLTAAALEETGLAPSRDYRLAVIGFDPKDHASDARRLGERIADPAIRRSARLLTGAPAQVDAATHLLGYGVVYDAASDQYAHDASVFVFDRDGRLAALLPELGTTPASLRAALAGTPVQDGLVSRIARLCYGLGEAHGRFGAAAILALQGLALATLLGMAAFLWRRRHA